MSGRDAGERFARFSPPDAGAAVWGRLVGERLEALSGAPWEAQTSPSGKTYLPDEVRLLAPAAPTKILALGYNFRDLFLDAAALSRGGEPHYEDPGFEPIIFLKAPNTLTASGAGIPYPAGAEEVWVEVEIAAVIGSQARGLRSRAEAERAVFGVTIANDVTALNVHQRDWHLARSKSLDGFCPLGPNLVRGVDREPRSMTTRINGRQTQASSSDLRVMDTLDTVVFLSQLMTLEPGDVVLTGTPRGARQSVVVPGDEVTLEVEGLGRLSNLVVAISEGAGSSAPAPPPSGLGAAGEER
jgi:2-keto-4-pentenoate hydratase/2-oxohepta-3-ene-1,7-dioic acid hydratase in catechol pathway